MTHRVKGKQRVPLCYLLLVMHDDFGLVICWAISGPANTLRPNRFSRLIFFFGPKKEQTKLFVRYGEDRTFCKKKTF